MSLSEQQMEEIIQKEGNPNFPGMQIGDDGMKYLCQTHYDFKEAQLINNNISDEGIRYLTQASWKNITFLGLSNNNIGSAGCKYITQAAFHRLTNLNLAENHIQEKGVVHLSKGQWKDLESISLRTNNLMGQGIRFLVRANCHKLQEVVLGNNRIPIQKALQLLLLPSQEIKMLQLRYQFFFHKKSINQKHKKFVQERLEEKYVDVYCAFEFMHL